MVLPGFAVAILFWRAGSDELHGTPTFYASLIRELVDSGDLLAIFHDERAYFLKPPLVLWAGALAAKLFGLNSFTVTLFPRAMAIACVALTYAIGRRLFTHHVGWWAAVICLTNSTFVQFSNTLRMDSTLLAGLLLAVLGGLHLPHTYASAAFFGGIALAAFAKGPLGLIPLVLVPLYCFLQKTSNCSLHWRWSILLLPLLAWWLYLGAEYGTQPLLDFARDAARVDFGESSLLASYLEEYVAKPARRFWPWLPFMLFGFLYAVKRSFNEASPSPDRAAYRWLIVWAVMFPTLAAFKPDHDIRYLYPSLPAWALLAAAPWGAWCTEKRQVVFTTIVGALALTVMLQGLLQPRPRDTRTAIAAMRANAFEMSRRNQAVTALSENVYDAAAPRRQHNEHDWIHFYLGIEPRVRSWHELDEVEQRDAVVFALRSKRLIDRLETLGYRIEHRSKEMVMARLIR